MNYTQKLQANLLRNNLQRYPKSINKLINLRRQAQSSALAQLNLQQGLKARVDQLELMDQNYLKEVVISKFKHTIKPQKLNLLERKQNQFNQLIAKAKSQTSLATQQIAIKSKYSKLKAIDIEFFSGVLGPENIIQEHDEIKPYNIDFTKKYVGQCSLVLTPQNEKQIQEILKYCNEKKLAVVPQGGNTGLVGGSVPLQDEIVISTKKLNKIIDFDPITGILTCESGCILEVLQNHVKSFGYMMPLDLGAKGSCMIGGNLSTNAGGIKFIKYGSMHGNTVGLNAVLPNGTLLDSTQGLRGSQKGFDLNHMFIGGEGTLGIITKCQILCHPLPTSRQVSLIASDDFEQILACLRHAKRELNDTLSAIEFMDYESVKFSLDYFKIENPIRERNYKYYLLIEASSNSCQDQLNQQFLEMLEMMGEQNMYQDAALCESESQIETVWKIREGISMATANNGFTVKFDVSLQSQDFADIIDKTQDLIGSKAIMIGHGHIGDGNLHLNCTIKGFDNKELLKELQKQLEPFVFDYINDKKGSISAEHGIGLQKVNYLPQSKQKEQIQYMKMIKNAFDPHGIMNPYKVLTDL
ncbi:d-lactate dehydrogenase mitochondrial precursor [Stylonychia lemnae]|uniref:D-lactate dehydrogenase mitochondrial n=1 Tax=Stylonychia lemnae TaxID=5949 RepID=A0A078A9I4_STYLE|nr:d-lactate dehydrogenase mitochondrial precursor [Stylonychia lemnae]|eukprot:CDW78252.1 d-lactate dehydrogenase mitochondrial precursor [Stylonychia lemnae]